MLEEDLYIPGQTIDSAESDSPLSAASYGSSEELNQLSPPLFSGPSTSQPNVSTEQGPGGSQVIRRSISERTKKRPSTNQSNSTTPPPPLPTQSPSNPRPAPAPWPRPRPTNNTSRPFKLHNLLQKRSGRDEGAGTDGEQSRKNKKEPAVPVPSNGGLHPLSIPDSSPGKTRRPASSGGRFPSTKPYFSTTGPMSNMMLGSNASINTLPMPKGRKSGGRDPSLALPSVENTNGEFGVAFPQNTQNEDSRLARARASSCPTPEDDGQRRSFGCEFEPFDLGTIGMHDHGRQVRPSYTRTSRDAGVQTDVEPVESNRWDSKLTAVLPPPSPPPKDIPGRSRSQPTPPGSMPNEISSPTTGLSRSVPDRISDRFDRNGDQFLSPHGAMGSGTMKSLSTSTLTTSPRYPNEHVPPLPQNGRSSAGFDEDDTSTIHSPNPEIPPNPRQHKLLEVIYSEMHAARFVNLAPLSLLENYIRTYFKSTCSFLVIPSWVDLLLTSSPLKTSVRTHL
jgi:hypothetical protein